MRQTTLILLMALPLASVAAIGVRAAPNWQGNNSQQAQHDKNPSGNPRLHDKQGSPQQGQKQGPSGEIGVVMKNVNYRFGDRMMIHIESLNGRLVPKEQGEIPVFDDKNSFILGIDSAEIVITPENLSRVMNEYVFAGEDSPLKNLTASIEGGQIKLKGNMAKKAGIPFETLGKLEATPEGMIRIRTTKIKAAKVPAKGLLDLFGLEIADLINKKPGRGVRVEDNDFILDPSKFFPPPVIQGKVTSVRIDRNRIVEVFGDSNQAKATAGSAGLQKQNYMAYTGARLRFGKLTMDDTDLIIIDADSRDPFDFYLDHYNEQLVAGYSKNTPQHGLRVFMPDFSKLRKNKAGAKR